MAARRGFAPTQNKKEASDSLGWKAVFLIWLAAIPFAGAALTVAAQKYPAQFQTALKFSQRELAIGQKAYFAYKADRAKDAALAAKKAKEAAENADDQQF